MMKSENKGGDLTIAVSNFHMSYDEMGEGSIPVIFLHGFPFDKSMWAEQMEFLKSSYRVIALDTRGFGKSTDEESELSIEMFGDDLISFLDALYIEKAVVCGLSMGGYITLNAHQRFPERFEALVLCDTQCIADPVEIKEKRLNTILDIEADGIEKFNENLIQNLFHKDSLISKKGIVKNLSKVVNSNSPQIISQGLIALANRSETCSSLASINVPTLIIVGREDTLTPLAESEKMHKSIKGSTLKVIDDAGHVSNLEQPNVFNQYLGDFLATLSGLEVEEMSEARHAGK
ncbi:alpha/beta hydrolase [Aquiflexum sp. TKW24L]|uniref:alpha/beta fold hydrolase n=1 Tax=Aquiflexum sp. TKW24L TaxID=2942212 RepID=UPI0020BDED63|nr:alpha/beta hydrolase [Aquiflexum sp. TKW24L]MCL6260131.1 alpha/beta hydrolase [Aquiflexum sp. TKW24L]